MQLEFELLNDKTVAHHGHAGVAVTSEQVRSPDGHSVAAHLLASAEIKHQIAQQCLDSILAAANLMSNSLAKGGKLLLCGNGGSAADCQHMAGELVNWLNKDFQRPGLAAISLTTDSSILSAIANDSGFESIFERQVQALGKPEDVLIGISTSGNSPNVVRAVIAAKKIRMKAIALTGDSGKLAEIADVTIAVPSNNTQYIQEGHLSIEHILCSLVEQQLFSDGGTVS
ncbi:MAG: D-sedoheptulose 7-phosphate isomerase [Microcoleus sp. PH2017_40_RAT_O_B]|jgi:D-sedoheptulose 7-phosphate isomerase|uniref:D-sedoheptulose-7-phosphate isomerase n=1 Tax=unclassified Microcoleus TaxID=2642155 RepID=UPI001D61B917|nr:MULTISPECIES: D-sedoheptulose 7-phosphate isomerase [unclassified Microcoleus]MCC3571007.1 D-sedoheptulose 7-phosphate isomerase [Microcoleus sp. PH2017_34_RAT_O_A]MCC3608614.1 D-sedoheptulose 7-phosphate isomerase [Microcoleus sp. PH2017_40_RAT_O_B]